VGNDEPTSSQVVLCAPMPSPALSGEYARFVPGTMIAERYRVVAQVGRGGMARSIAPMTSGSDSQWL